MKGKGVSSSRNGVLIAGFVILALGLGIWLTNRSSDEVPAEVKLEAKAVVQEKPYHATVDGGIFAIIDNYHHADCTSYSTRSTSPIAGLAKTDSECSSISIGGALFHVAHTWGLIRWGIGTWNRSSIRGRLSHLVVA